MSTPSRSTQDEIPGIEALGIPNYHSLLDVPGEIDYVVCAVPRAVAPRVVADCVTKGVGGVTLFTSGFAETGEEEGIRLQEEIARLARESGLVLMGPNCMGIYNPALGVRQAAEQPAGESGSVGFISQSGTHAINFSLLGRGSRRAHQQVGQHGQRRGGRCLRLPGVPGGGRGDRHHRPLPGGGWRWPPLLSPPARDDAAQAGGHLEGRTDGGRPAGRRLPHGGAGRGVERLGGRGAPERRR